MLVVNGQVVLREGDVVDGRTLLGDARSVAMNRQGDWAVVWRTREPGIGSAWLDRSAVLLNGRTILLEGAAAQGGGTVGGLDAPLCLGDRSMAGYADAGVVGMVTPVGTNAQPAQALLLVHAMTGLAGCCPADLASGDLTVEGETPDGRVTPADLAQFIRWYTAADPRADLDNGSASGVPDGQFTEADVSYYLAHYFAGCLEAL
ncbi:MAG: hypothetical protein K2Q09_06500 [Phycisphaerales bacterium]|nr:hypothetical protein [Phycisphaerales bacterium]